MFERESAITSFNLLGRWMECAISGEQIPGNVNPDLLSAVQTFRLEMENAVNYNGWFTLENVKRSIRELVGSCYGGNLENWLLGYPSLPMENKTPKKVAVIMAGNIPLVGFHDFLCVLFSGNYFVGKLSSQDNRLFPALLNLLRVIDPEIAGRAEFCEGKLQGFDAVIATGSNNTSRYFDFYFGKYPHIIRKNRNSVCVLDGSETREDLVNLSGDIFQYFGLGCRNVSKLYIKKGYDFSLLFESFEPWREELVMHNKYMNNLNYNRSVYLMDSISFLDNGFVLLKEDLAIASPISVLFYELYEDIEVIKKQLASQSDLIQCIVAKPGLIDNSVSFGQSQSPSLTDYADGVDVMEFLMQI